ncbi:uncharacterized protein LOC131598867 [Vicia villosa]|uniref:uncharacterized protein LOC131598867 n=1 Tax=Vicia villosa TaxID=3911 RepID=UPI00273C13B5|nr:uncharacterized protein LOC131598867 [Vicia villosa]XP_058727421.1 uncharacterized protein LOC131598867 [Vicia villosa]
MASESAELPPVTPEVTTSPVVERRKAGSGKSSEKVVPRYLRASTGSCHDRCKYGGNHSIDPKERRSIPDRATRKQLYHQTRGESIGGMVAKSRLSVDSKLTKMSTDVLKESADSKPRKMSTVVLKEAVGSKARTSDSLEAKNRKKTSSVEVKPSLVSKSLNSPSTSQEISSSIDKEMQLLKTPSKSISKVESISKPTSQVKTSSKSTVVPVEAVPKSILKKVENPSKSISKVKTSSKFTSKTEGTSSHLRSSNGTEMKLLTKPSSSLSSIRGATNKGSNEIKTEKKVASFKASPRKLKVPIKALSSPRASIKHKNLKIVSPLKNQKAATKVELEEHENPRNQKTLTNVELEENKIHEVKEKTLYVIETETENKTLQSNQNATYDDDESYLPQLLTPESSSTSVTQSISEENQDESEYTTSEYELASLSGNSEIESIINNETLMVDKPGKVKEVEDKDSEMAKLKLRKGKVVDNQSERNTPRKLKFRRAKALEEKANVKEKVVLRHQDFEDKKDAQGLFNNVIEETASKLVEARKSKVKALVGAFETVISLQEK